MKFTREGQQVTATFKERMTGNDILVGTFVKTPAHEVVEVLAKSALDFLCFDAEHAPFDRARLDACLAVARALGVPALVRVPSATPADILQVLDSGATGIVVPHVDTVEKARAVARAAHFGQGGRGFAGSTRWAGFATRPMADVLAQSAAETVVIVQIEEPEGVEAAAEIAALPGIDGLFVGPADLAVCYGSSDPSGPEVTAAMARTGAAAQAAGKRFMTFAGSAASGQSLASLGVTMFFVASEHAFMLRGANAEAAALHDLA